MTSPVAPYRLGYFLGCLALCSPVRAADKPVRTDRFGVPLPAGAIARLGSSPLRHDGLAAFVFLPGGKGLLSVGSDRTVRTWEAAGGRLVRAVPLEGSAGTGRAVALSADGKLLASHDQGRLFLWQTASGKQIKVLPAAKAGVAFLQFSPDGKTLAAGAWDGRVVLWDWGRGQQRRVALPVRSTDVNSTFHACFSHDGRWLTAGGGWEEPLCLFESATGRLVRRLAADASASAFSPDGLRLAVAGMHTGKGGVETVLRILAVADGRELARFPQGTDDCFLALAFSADGKELACGGAEQGRVVDAATGKVLHRLPGRPWGPSFAPDGKLLAAGSAARIRLWELPAGKERHGKPAAFGWDLATALSPDGRVLATAEWAAGGIRLWELATGRPTRLLPLQAEHHYVRGLGFAADGQTLVVCQYNGLVQFWDVGKGKLARSVQLQRSGQPNMATLQFSHLDVTPDARHLATLERLGEEVPVSRLAFWDAGTGKLLHERKLPSEASRGVWSADGSAAALLLGDGVTLTDVRTGGVRFRVPGTLPNSPLALSLDDRLLACCRAVPGKEDSGAVVVLEAITGGEVAAVATGPVDQLALASDGRSLVTTDGQSLRVWDLATGKERQRWALPSAGSVVGLVLAPGRRAITRLGDGTALVWDLAGAVDVPGPLAGPGSDRELAGCWADLTGAPPRAHAAAWRLAAVPKVALPFLRRHLRPADEADLNKVRQLLADLGNDRYRVRQKAARELEGLGRAAAPALRNALKEKLPLEVHRRVEVLLTRTPGIVRAPEVLRRLRAVAILEQIGSAEARQFLQELARGAPAALETEEARTSLARLVRRPGPP